MSNISSLHPLGLSGRGWGCEQGLSREAARLLDGDTEERWESLDDSLQPKVALIWWQAQLFGKKRVGMWLWAKRGGRV